MRVNLSDEAVELMTELLMEHGNRLNRQGNRARVLGGLHLDEESALTDELIETFQTARLPDKPEKLPSLGEQLFGDNK